MMGQYAFLKWNTKAKHNTKEQDTSIPQYMVDKRPWTIKIAHKRYSQEESSWWRKRAHPHENDVINQLPTDHDNCRF